MITRTGSVCDEIHSAKAGAEKQTPTRTAKKKKKTEQCVQTPRVKPGTERSLLALILGNCRGTDVGRRQGRGRVAPLSARQGPEHAQRPSETPAPRPRASRPDTLPLPEEPLCGVPPARARAVPALTCRPHILDHPLGLEHFASGQQRVLPVGGVEVTPVKKAHCGGRLLRHALEEAHKADLGRALQLQRVLRLHRHFEISPPAA